MIENCGHHTGHASHLLLPPASNERLCDDFGNRKPLSVANNGARLDDVDTWKSHSQFKSATILDWLGRENGKMRFEIHRIRRGSSIIAIRFLRGAVFFSMEELQQRSRALRGG